MGNCIYCEQKAGFLRKKHKECELKNHTGQRRIINSICTEITSTSDFYNLEYAIKNIANQNFIKLHEITPLYTKGFDSAIASFLDDGILTIEEEEKVAKFKAHYCFNDEVLDKNGSLQKVVKASILRNIMEGKIPQSRLKINGNLPFMLQKSETVIWIFQNVDYYEQRTRTVYQGRSQGVSIKITKGVYYKTGTFSGYPVKVEEMKLLSRGLVALTDKHIYFASTLKNFKVSYNKIVTIDPYEDGVGFQKDGVSSKPQVFRGLDGWFTYNLISNLNQM